MANRWRGAALAIVLLCGRGAADEWQSALVRTDPRTGRLIYAVDAAGNRIPDFSHAGYQGGGIPPPPVPVVRRLSPMPGDNTARIQALLDTIAALPADEHGIRGALLLAPGIFEIHGTLRISGSGVVLRGAGDDADPLSNTILLGKGNTPHQRTLVVAGGGSSTRWREQVHGTLTTILDDTVHVSRRWFRVANPAPFAAGDNVILTHPCTEAWLAEIDGGGTHSTEPAAEPGVDVPWAVNSQPILYNRFITAIRGDTLWIDAPVLNPLVRALAQSTVYTYARTGLRRMIGLERLRLDIETAGGEDENHCWNAVEFSLVEDCWITRCTALHFGHAGFMTRTATRMTIDSCRALDPVSVITGERRYNVDMYDASQLILVSNALATYGRHDFVSNGASWTSGCVFLDCRSEHTYASSEGHRRWSTGLLFDRVTFVAPNTSFVLGLYNRGYYGTSHGWAIAHAVAWNCDAGNALIVVQRPPTAQNYAIGCRGIVSGVKPPAPFNEPEGYIEGTNVPGLVPPSLYRAQLAERLGVPLGVHDPESVVEPDGFRLDNLYPNPFNGSATVRYHLTYAGEIRITVRDVLGREIALLVEGREEAGSHQLRWEGSGYASGVYFCTMVAGSVAHTKRVLLLR